jgi:hypothetical protein
MGQKIIDSLVKFLVVVFGIIVMVILFLQSANIDAHGCGDKKTIICYNGKEFDTGYMMYNNRLFVPLRTISNNLGAEVEWNAKDRTINISTEYIFTQFQLGSKFVYIHHGDSITMDVEPMIIDGRTFVPIRFAAESLGKFVDYYEDHCNRVVNITDTKSTQEVE